MSEQPGSPDPARRRSLRELARTYLATPEAESAMRRFGAALAAAAAAAADWSAEVESAVALLAADPRVDHSRLVRAASRRLATRSGVGTALAHLRSGEPLTPSDIDAAAAGLASPLSLRLLADHVYADTQVEMLLRALRAQWLGTIMGDTSGRWPSQDLLAAVALQMQTIEWMYPETPRQASVLEALAARLVAAPTLRAALVYAMYRPLEELAPTIELLEDAEAEGGLTAELARRHLLEPGRERALAEEIPRLTDVTDPVSRAVRAQYEERPYPRWRHVAPSRPRRVGDVVAAAVGNPEIADAIDIRAPRILIAGCGTGRHAVLTAARYAGSHVLAVDLSASSLAYAVGRTRELGLDNVEFAVADILHLAEPAGPFDIIECVGVLHHTSDPEAAWGRLRDLLRPGGLMKLGLYSRLGRRVLGPAEQFIADRDLQPDREGIDAVRTMIRALPAEHPASRLAQAPDFYTRSGCRDLFFPAHEVRFDLPRIDRALAALRLEFLGFEVPAHRVRDLYRRSFPEEVTGRSLAHWHRLERAYPLMFSAMYRFWARSDEGGGPTRSHRPTQGARPERRA